MAFNRGAVPVADRVDEWLARLAEPPMASLRERLEQLPEPLQVLVLVTDFDTEASMNGLLGFLENSTGARLPETIAAFDAIGAHATAQTLQAVQQVMQGHGLTHGMLRQPLSGLQQYAITSFAQRHGPAGEAMAQDLVALERTLYIYDPADGEAVFELLCEYLEPRRDEVLATLARGPGLH